MERLTCLYWDKILSIVEKYMQSEIERSKGDVVTFSSRRFFEWLQREKKRAKGDTTAFYFVDPMSAHLFWRAVDELADKFGLLELYPTTKSKPKRFGKKRYIILYRHYKKLKESTS